MFSRIFKGTVVLLTFFVTACSMNPTPVPVLPRAEHAALVGDVVQQATDAPPTAVPTATDTLQPALVAPDTGFKGEFYFYYDQASSTVRGKISLFDMESQTPIHSSFVIVRFGEAMLFNGSVNNDPTMTGLPMVEVVVPSYAIQGLTVQVTDALDGRKCTLTVNDVYVQPDGTRHTATCSFSVE